MGLGLDSIKNQILGSALTVFNKDNQRFVHPQEVLDYHDEVRTLRQRILASFHAFNEWVSQESIIYHIINCFLCYYIV